MYGLLGLEVKHLFTECEALGAMRQRIFGTHKPIIHEIPVSQVNRFLTEASHIPWLPEGYKP